MRINEVLEPYFKKMGLRYISGNYNSIEPLLIFVIHDIIYQTYEEEIKNRPLKHLARRYQKEWDKLNDSHFKSFFKEMDEERQNLIIDYMDDFEAYIGNELMMIKCRVMDCFSFLEFKEQKFRASLETCNLLAQIANIHWSALVKRPSGNLSKNPYDARVLFLTESISRALYNKSGDNVIESKKVDELVKMIQVFERKIITYINIKTKEKEKEEDEKDKN